MYKQDVIDFFREKFLKIASAMAGFASIFIFISFVSYDSSDPSFNNATDKFPSNFMGYLGAHTADILYQFFGLAGGLIFSTLFLMWAYRFYSGRFISKLWIRAIAAFMAASCAAAILAGIVDYGGVIGGFLKSSLYLELTPPIFNGLFIVLFLLIGHFATGLRLRETKDFYDKIIGVFNKAPEVVGKAKPKRGARVRRGAHKTNPEVNEYLDKIRPAKDGSSSPRPQPKQASLLIGNMDDDFELPPTELLREPPSRYQTARMSETSLSQNAKILEKVLGDFGIKGEITSISPGPVVTLYEFEPVAGVKSSKVVGLAEDIARSMSAVSARISVIPGQTALGIELPNSKRETVYQREINEADAYTKTEAKLPLTLGKDIGGEPIIADLAKMPHLLVAGTTGSGKSVSVNSMILSLLYKLSPSKCKFIMIDPKMLELSVYQGIPHLLAPVVTEPQKAVVALKWVVKEMENRYRLMSTVGVRNIDGFNARIEEAISKNETLERKVQIGYNPETGEPMFETQAIEMVKFPYIVVIVDEMADLMLVAGKEIEASIQRLAQMARAAGIHLIMATQRPSVDVITGVIKANFPTRISFQVTSKIDSRTILGEQGAEQLLGQGDMLYMSGGGRINRIHGAFVGDREIEKIVNFLKQQGKPEYVDEVTRADDSDDDPGTMGGAYGAAGGGLEGEDANLYDQAVQIVLRDKRVSTSYIQRRLRIGYNRAASLIEQMEQQGVISAPSATGKREILVPGESAG